LTAPDYYSQWIAEINDAASSVKGIAESLATKVNNVVNFVIDDGGQAVASAVERGISPSEAATTWGYSKPMNEAGSQFLDARFDIGGQFKVDPSKGEVTVGAHGTATINTPPIPNAFGIKGVFGVNFTLDATHQASEHAWNGSINFTPSAGLSWGIEKTSNNTYSDGRTRSTILEGGASVTLQGTYDYDLHTGNLVTSAKVVAEVHFAFIVGNFRKEYSAEWDFPIYATPIENV